MGRSLPLLLTRIATLVMAGLLLFAVFGHARAAAVISILSPVMAHDMAGFAAERPVL
jgi:hypothetical protein